MSAPSTTFTFTLDHAPSPSDVAAYFAESSTSTSTARGRGERDDDERLKEKLKSGMPTPAFLPYYDTLQTADETVEMRYAYRRMLADGTVKGAFLTKILNVMATELVVKPPRWLKDDDRAKEVAEFIEWNLQHGMHEGVPGMAWDVLSGALIDGYSVCEKVWGQPEAKGRWEGKRRLARLKAKDVFQDLVPEMDEFNNITGIRGLRFNDGTVFDPSDFVIYSHLGLFENPVGMSDFRSAYRPWWLLDTTWKLRMIGVEKRSMPIIVGHWKEEIHRGKLEGALASVKMRNWLAVPESARVEALEIAGQSHQIFAETVRDLREDINVAINGAILAAMTGDGQRGDSNVHKDTGDLRPWHLCAALAHILNDHDKGLVRDIVDRNFAGIGDYPIVSFGGIDDRELKESVSVDESLNRILQIQGKAIDPEFLSERYGRPIIDLPEQGGAGGGDPNAPGGGPAGGGSGGPGGADGGEGDDVNDNPTGSMYGPGDDEESESGLPWFDGAIETDPDDTSVADELAYDPWRDGVQREMAADEDGTTEEGDEEVANVLAEIAGNKRRAAADDGSDGDDDDEPDDSDTVNNLFSESDWYKQPGPRSYRRWVNRKTGQIYYSDENPGKSAAASPARPTPHLPTRRAKETDEEFDGRVRAGIGELMTAWKQKMRIENFVLWKPEEGADKETIRIHDALAVAKVLHPDAYYAVAKAADTIKEPEKKPADRIQNAAPAITSIDDSGFLASVRNDTATAAIHRQMLELHAKETATIARRKELNAELRKTEEGRFTAAKAKKQRAILEEFYAVENALLATRRQARKLMAHPNGNSNRFLAGRDTVKADPTLPRNLVEIACEFLGETLSPNVEMSSARIGHGGESGRAFARGSEATVFGSDWVTDYIHELGHVIEDQNPAAHKACVDLLQHRCGSEPLKPMREFGDGFRSDEAGCDDHFARHFGGVRGRYFGKDYSGVGDYRVAKATEVLSMGLEELYNDPLRLAVNDPEIFRFVLGVVHGRVGAR